MKENHTSTYQNSIHLPVLDALLAKANHSETQQVLEKTVIYYAHHPLTNVN